MITKLYIKNFRSIVDNEIDLGKINILTGPNNSGKSSVIYGLLALKNIVLNSNQSLDNCLTPGFVNLGGFDQAVHLKNEIINILLSIEVEKENIKSQYIASLGKSMSKLTLNVSKPSEVSFNLEVSFPYPTNKDILAEIKGEFGSVYVKWNGITAIVEFGDEKMGNRKEVNDIFESISIPVEELRGVDFIPLRRGFVKPVYSTVPMQQQLLTDDELATLLATNRDLEGKVAFYLEKLVNRVFSVRSTIGTSYFNLQSRDRATGFVSDLVNEGFGTNQLVTILTKALRKEVSTICIEELEIHLHPELMDKLIDVFIEIVKNENKNFIISTHSEHIVLSLLNKVAKKKIHPDDIRIYYLSKEGKETKIEKQEVNEKGQVSGGLKGFYETELKEVREFFDISEEK